MRRKITPIDIIFTALLAGATAYSAVVYPAWKAIAVAVYCAIATAVVLKIRPLAAVVVATAMVLAAGAAYSGRWEIAGCIALFGVAPGRWWRWA